MGLFFVSNGEIKLQSHPNSVASFKIWVMRLSRNIVAGSRFDLLNQSRCNSHSHSHNYIIQSWRRRHNINIGAAFATQVHDFRASLSGGRLKLKREIQIRDIDAINTVKQHINSGRSDPWHPSKSQHCNPVLLLRNEADNFTP